MPQIVYTPSTAPYITATNTAAAGVLPVAAQPTISPTAVAASASQVVDYSAYPGGIPNMAGYEALSAQYANAYMTPVTAAAAYTYSMPQPLGLAAAATHYQPQQIQERMQ